MFPPSVINKVQFHASTTFIDLGFFSPESQHSRIPNFAKGVVNVGVEAGHIEPDEYAALW